VEYYDFEVIQGDKVISAETSVALESSRAAWPKILKIARKLDLPGCRIRVREHEGETVILIGAVAARRFPDVAFCA
jgi:hypothetical protein